MSPSPPPIAWLFSRQRFGIKLGLQAVDRLLQQLGRPCSRIPTILVAGTNGKGSTATMTAGLLTASGVPTLLYTSPHVVSVRERILLDGRPIAKETLERHLETVRLAVRQLRHGGRLPHDPTFFEVLTAAALLHGQTRNARALVLEVGLGGRFDATNVLPAQVAVITNVALDHTAYLGRTPARIAWNKAGIIKGGETVVTGVSEQSALKVIGQTARQRQARLLRVHQKSARRGHDGTWDLDLALPRRVSSHPLPARLTRCTLGLDGLDQGTNAVMALTAAAALLDEQPHRRLTIRGMRHGLLTSRLPGRLELRQARQGRTVILDGAHNPAAARRLAQTIRPLAEHRPVTLLLGVMADKDGAGMVQALAPVARRLVFCRPRHKRALPPRRLLSLLPSASPPVQVVADPEAAFQTALATTPASGLLLVTGSFYLLGDLAPRTGRLRRLVNRPSLDGTSAGR